MERIPFRGPLHAGCSLYDDYYELYVELGYVD